MRTELPLLLSPSRSRHPPRGALVLKEDGGTSENMKCERAPTRLQHHRDAAQVRQQHAVPIPHLEDDLGGGAGLASAGVPTDNMPQHYNGNVRSLLGALSALHSGSESARLSTS